MNRRAFGLLESILTAGLLAVVFSVVAVLASQFNRITSSAGGKDIVLESSSVALDWLRSDIEACESRLPPGPYQIHLSRVDPIEDRRYDPVNPGVWKPFRAVHCIKVGYRMDSAGLMRDVNKNGNVETCLVTTGVSGLTYTADDDRGTIAVHLSFQLPDGKVKRVNATFLRRLWRFE